MKEANNVMNRHLAWLATIFGMGALTGCGPVIHAAHSNRPTIAITASATSTAKSCTI